MLIVKDLTFKYDKSIILDRISLTAKAGEHIAIIGESGSGKSTFLKLLYGEFDLFKGSIFWKDTQILGPSHNLVIGYSFMKYVAQEFDLMPYITVSENIGAFLSNFKLKEKQERIDELLAVVELSEFAQVKVQFLSGGQKQRVALARAIALHPEIILLDEPFSHIDNFKKQSLRRNLFKFLKKHNITCIVATHDKDDVIAFSDKIMVLSQGKIVAKGTPKDLYKSPKTPLVASFFGEYNHIANHGIVYASQIVVVNSSKMKAKVLHSYFQGKYYLIEASLNEQIILFESRIAYTKNTTVFLSIKKD